MSVLVLSFVRICFAILQDRQMLHMRWNTFAYYVESISISCILHSAQDFPERSSRTSSCVGGHVARGCPRIRSISHSKSNRSIEAISCSFCRSLNLLPLLHSLVGRHSLAASSKFLITVVNCAFNCSHISLSCSSESLGDRVEIANDLFESVRAVKRAIVIPFYIGLASSPDPQYAAHASINARRFGSRSPRR